jgi:hypothetical protein
MLAIALGSRYRRGYTIVVDTKESINAKTYPINRRKAGV